MRKGCSVVAVGLAMAMAVSGCYGPFNLVRRLHHWNGQVSNDKWAREAVFIVLAWVPVYSLATLGDALIFNSIEFWTGNNPVAPVVQNPDVQTKRIARHDAEAILTRMKSPAGQQLMIEQFRKGERAASLRIEQQDGLTKAFDGAGRQLYQAQTLGDGGIAIQDAQGRQIAQYSADQVDRLMQSSRQ